MKDNEYCVKQRLSLVVQGAPIDGSVWDGFRGVVLEAIRLRCGEHMDERRRGCVLVLDPPTLHAVSCAITMTELTDAGCSTVHTLGEGRASHSHAVYMISPQYVHRSRPRAHADNTSADVAGLMAQYCTREQWALVNDGDDQLSSLDIVLGQCKPRAGARKLPYASASLFLTSAPADGAWEVFAEGMCLSRHLDPVVQLVRMELDLFVDVRVYNAIASFSTDWRGFPGFGVQHCELRHAAVSCTPVPSLAWHPASHYSGGGRTCR